MSKSTVASLISIYQYLMPVLAFIGLLIIPWIERHQYFVAPLLDLLVRVFLWVYFAFAYWSISVALKNRIYKKQGFGFNFEMHKDITSFISLSVSAIGIGIFVLFLSKWALSVFIPQIPATLNLSLSIANGGIYGALVLLQYVFLPED